MRTLPQGSFYAGLALSLGLMLVGAWDMRMWLHMPSARPIPDEIRGPRLSRKAVAGAVVGMSGLLVPLLAGAAVSVTVPQPAPGEVQAGVMLAPLLVIGLPAVLAGGVATLLGWLAIADIRGAAGRLTGLGLAFADAVAFPLLMSFALLTGLLFLATNRLTIDPPQSDFVASLVIAALLWLPAASVITRRMWRRVSGAAVPGPASGPTPIASTTPAADSQFGGRDWVVLSLAQVEADDLPDVCIVCGRPAMQRVNRTFSFQAEWAQILTLVGMLAFVIPGLIVDAFTREQLRVACPVCPQHRNHWSRFTWWASLGWLIPLTLGGAGALVGLALKPPGGGDLQLLAGVIGAVVGLIAYIAPMIWMATHLVDAEEITRSSIRLRRVSAEFARLAGRRSQPGASPVPDPGSRPAV